MNYTNNAIILDDYSTFIEVVRDMDNSSSSPSSPMHPQSYSAFGKPDVTKTKSNKRRTMLVVDGYHFQLKNFNSKKTMKFWRCANRNCRDLMHTTVDDQFIRYAGKTTTHSYLPMPAESEIRNLIERECAFALRMNYFLYKRSPKMRFEKVY